MPSDEAIGRFWHWFASVAARLGVAFEPALHDELDDRLAQLGQVAWELGPGLRAPHWLVISPDGALAWLPVTQRIVELAPLIEGWEFHASRPPKRWSLQFQLSQGKRMVPIDAREWRYILYEVSPSQFDIVVEQRGLRGATDGTRFAATCIVLDGQLGEAERLTRFRDIEWVKKLTVAQAGEASRLVDLADHLAQVVDGVPSKPTA